MIACGHDMEGTSPADFAAEAAALFDCYEILGHRARVGVPEPHVQGTVRRILSCFGPLAMTPGRPFVPYLLTIDAAGAWTVAARGVVRHTSDNFDTALAALEWQILTDALARCRGLFHLHGASLSAPARDDGLVLIGDSGSGKTTLTLGLMLRGFAPLSDDVTLLDTDTLAACPFPRAFHLEEGTRHLLAARDLPAAWALAAMPPGYFLPPRWATAPVPIRCVLFPRYEEGAAPQLTRLAIPDAASLLLGHTISLARLPRVALGVVSRLTAQAGCYRLVSGDLDAALDAIVALLAQQSSAPSQLESAR